jgi:DNA (cytosine-5)-methyltransferase 1
MHKRCREIMDELILSGELEEITWFKFAPKQELKLRLKDMLEDEVDEKYLLNQELVSKYLETGTASNHKGSQAGKVADENDETFWTVNAGTHGYSMGYVKLKQTHTLNIKGNDSIKRIYSSDGLCQSLTTMQGGHREPKVAIANGLIEVSDEVRVKEATKLGYKVAEEGDSINISVPSSKTRRGRVGKQVAQTLDTACNQVVFNNQYIFRKLTPRECFRLQGFDDSFVFPAKISSTQLYKQAGNGMSRNILDMIFTQIFTCYSKHIEKNINDML